MDLTKIKELKKLVADLRNGIEEDKNFRELLAITSKIEVLLDETDDIDRPKDPPKNP